MRLSRAKLVFYHRFKTGYWSELLGVHKLYYGLKAIVQTLPVQWCGMQSDL